MPDPASILSLRIAVSCACSISLPDYKGLNQDSRGHGASRRLPSHLQQSQDSHLCSDLNPCSLLLMTAGKRSTV